MESIWRKETPDIKSKTRKSHQNTHRDVIVIGAGLAGILTAYYLQKEGKNVLVLEAAEIASGQTERTTAKITSQHDIKYSNLIKTIGVKKAKMYADANEMAIKEYERLIKEKNIECNFEKVSAYLYTLENEELIIKEADAANALGINAFLTRDTKLPFPVKNAVCFRNQAQFSPLKFVKQIALELEILEHTKVIDIKGHRVITEKEVFTADKIVMATHYPIINAPGFYFLKQHQERSYALALLGCTPIKAMYYGIDSNGLSFRQSGDILILGGAGRRTGHNKKGRAFNMLREAAKKYYPESTETAHWAAQDCMPHDGIPFIGKFSVFTPNLYVITGFQKWGMTSAMAAAMILRDELSGRKNTYSKVFCPQRFNIIAGIKKLLIDIGESVKGLSKGWLHFPPASKDTLSNGNGGVVVIDGKRYACYCDENGKLHKISARCPHLGCELTWNPDEKSWDCPCHGSRFDVDGKLLDNPSKKNLI